MQIKWQHKSEVVASCLKGTINHFSNSLHLIKRAPRIFFAWHGKWRIHQQKGKRHSLMAHPFDWAQKSNVVQLIVGTRSYSVRCNIQNSAERKVYYNEHGRISHTPPMSHSAFFPTVLFMFQPLNKHVDLFFRGQPRYSFSDSCEN